MNLNYIKSQFEKIIDYKDINELKARMKQYPNMEYHVERADQLCNNIFVFDNVWDMERCSKPYELNPLVFDTICNDDEEWCFVLNRMEYLSHLVKAYLYTEDEKYVENWKRLVFAWMDEHPTITKKNTTRTLDTSMRCYAVLEDCCMLYAFKQITDEELERICTSILEQISYLKENYLNKYTLSNWGSIQVCYILTSLAQLDENYLSNEIYQWALEEFKTQLDIQVYDDGMHWEQSTMYHVEVLHAFLRLAHMSHLFEMTIADNFIEKIKNMSYALFNLATPNYTIDTFGDSDNSDIRDMMCKASVLLNDPILKSKAYDEFDEDSLYEFGAKKANEFKQLDSVSSNQQLYVGNDSGIYTYRTSQNTDASFTQFICGGLGSGHGHSDTMHVSVYYDGKPFLIDSGRFTYREDHPLREYLKSMAAHNTVVVDGKPASRPKGSWGYDGYVLPLKPYVKEKEGCLYIEATLLAEEGYTHTRKLVNVTDKIWMIYDEVRMDGKHEMISYYHLDPKVVLEEIEKNKFTLVNEGSYLTFKLDSKENIKEISKKECSKHYNELMMHEVMQITSEFENFGNKCDIITNNEIKLIEDVEIYQDANAKPMSSDIVTAKKFTLNEKESFVVILVHQEIFKGRKIFYYEDVPFYGKCVILHQKNNSWSRINLKV